MTRAELRAEVKQAYPFATDDALINAAINWAYREAARIWGPRKRANLSLTASVYSYPLPRDCWVVQTVLLDGEPLERRTESFLDHENPGWRKDRGTPLFFFVQRQEATSTSGGTIYFAPPPDRSYTVELLYSFLPSNLASDTDEPILPPHLHDALWQGGCFRYAQIKEDPTALAVFAPWWDGAKAQIAEDARLRYGKKTGIQTRPWVIG